MKKTLFFCALVLLSQAIFSQDTDCSDVTQISCCQEEGNPIPPFSKLSCTDDGALYAMFPQVLSYKDYVFNQIQSCHKPEVDGYVGTLQFSYCIPKLRKFMTISITDFSMPFYQTSKGKAIMDMYLLSFHPSAINLGSREVAKIENKDIKNEMRVFSPRFSPYGGFGDTVSFFGYYQKRYYVEIHVDDEENLFTSPEQFELFIKEYVEMLSIR